MVPLRQLELHVTHLCNLACDGCRHFSNFGMTGKLDYATGETWLKAWSARVSPTRFKLLGGEPTLNKELHKFIRLVPEIWPECRDYTLTTNGLTAPKWSVELIDAILETGTRVYLTKHSETDERYLSLFNRGLEAMICYGIMPKVDPTAGWYRGYKGTGNNILPFHDGDQRASWGRCDSKWCMQLHENRLWKCAPLAYWGQYVEKFPNVERAEWGPYFDYYGIGLKASDDELTEFAGREDEAACALCPKNPDIYEKSVWKS